MVDKNKTAVANDVMSYCTKCKIITNHVVTAHVDGFVCKVKCHECGSVHKYRDQVPKTKTRKTGKEDGAVLLAEYEGLIKEHGSDEIVKYSSSKSYEVNDVLDHPKFGKGIVKKIYLRKAEILFKEGLKVLVCNRG